MCERLTQEEKDKCNAGQGCCIYRVNLDVPSYDKGDHKLRSIANSPQHRRHWKKEETIKPKR